MYLRIQNDCLECQVCGNIPKSIFQDRQGNSKCCLCLDDNETIFVKHYILAGHNGQTKVELNFMTMKEFKKQDIGWKSSLA